MPPLPRPPRRPPALEEEHVEEILLRFPPNQPAGLFRAALVCKRWRRLISSAAFRRRYREFHRRPPILGLLSNDDGPTSTNASAMYLPRGETRRDWRVLDARHGRVLFQHVAEQEDDEEEDERRRGLDLVLRIRVGEKSRESSSTSSLNGASRGGFFVTVPFTKEQREVPMPMPSQGLRTLAAAVLCSDTTGACDHLDCHHGPFLVVLVASRFASNTTLIYTYSSETARWSDPPISTQPSVIPARLMLLMPSAYVGSALYFGFRNLKSILKYDLQSGQVSWIQLPSMCTYLHPNVFTSEAGVLGLATIRHSRLYVWSMKEKDAPPQVDDAGWTQAVVIELRKALAVEDLLALREPHVVAFHRFGVVLFWANGMIHAVALKTGQLEKIRIDSTIYTIIPYMGFCTPAL